MRSSFQILPGVAAVRYLDCDKLIDNVALRGICMMPVPVLTSIFDVDILDEAECSCKTERDGAGYMDSASLKFLSNVLLPTHLNLGFVVTDIYGKSYLIGAKEPPFPQVKMELRCGTTAGDSAGYLYEISHQAIKSLIACSISF
jgi:hypothetical protein